MDSTCVGLLLCLTLAAAVGVPVEESKAQVVLSHLQQLMPLGLGAERYRRQAPGETETVDGSNSKPPPEHFFGKCCKGKPHLIPKEAMKVCFKQFKHNRGGPGGPGGPRGPGGPGGPGGRGGPPPPPPPEGSDGPRGPPPSGGEPEDFSGDDESGQNDVEDLDIEEGSNDQPSAQLQQKDSDDGNSNCRKGGRWRSMRDGFACAMECAFENATMLKDGKVDQEAYAAYAIKVAEEKDGEIWKPAIEAALKNCSVSAPVDSQQKCKSGAMEMTVCMHRQLFVNCPESKWNSSAKCDECRTSIDKCGWRRKKHDKKTKSNGSGEGVDQGN